MNKIRTRFAPSPTGYMHVGNLRTALYAFLVAKRDGGTFILRIEDTDQTRLVDGAVDIIYNTLRLAGLNWDEGPDIGGDYGSYVQSERMASGMYKEYAEKLVESGAAYYCFCPPERLDAVRESQQKAGQPAGYDRHCRNLSAAEVEELKAKGTPFVIRQKLPLAGKTSFDDIVFGQISVDNNTLDDQVLIKADGFPTYNFANVIDDHTMGITHVVRGNEYLSSTPKYNLLYEAFGWEKPEYIHCPPVMKTPTEKLSKRNGDASFEDLLDAGYLPAAVLNFIALLGWSPGGENEIYSLDELIEAFDPKGISKSPAIFDTDKLRAINGQYIRNLQADEFVQLATPYIRQTVSSDIDIPALCDLLKPRCELFTDIPKQVDFFDVLPDYDTELFRNKKMKTTPEGAKATLSAILPILESITDWTQDTIHTALFDYIAQNELKNGAVLFPLRVAVSGKQFTPGGGIELAVLFGKDETIKRIAQSIAKL